MIKIIIQESDNPGGIFEISNITENSNEYNVQCD